MSYIRLVFLFILIADPFSTLFAQSGDSSAIIFNKLPAGYFTTTQKKIKQYSNRMSNKTEKTLERLSRWENKIYILLKKTNPEAASQLFSNRDLTFAGMLEQYRNGKSVVQGYQAVYDEHLDKLTTQIKYIDTNRSLLSIHKQQLLDRTIKRGKELQNREVINDVLRKAIVERKKHLLSEAVKHFGNNKNLKKINEETYYYLETVKNYKKLFKDKTKREEVTKQLLQKLPGFNDFMRKNSMLASLFKVSDSYGTPQSLAGLQTRADISRLIQTRIGSGGSNAVTEIKQNMQAAQVELNKLKDKLLKAGGGIGEVELPNFKPNTQKTKTFDQRLEYGINFQFGKRNNFMPGTADLGLSIGYKLNDKSLIGIGFGYKLGMGSIDKIRFSHEGIGLRSFIDWKLKKQFFVTGGFEINHNAAFKDVSVLKDFNAWQQSGLIGVSKKINLKTKISKGTQLQLLYDFLYKQSIPGAQPIVFRVGYRL